MAEAQFNPGVATAAANALQSSLVPAASMLSMAYERQRQRRLDEQAAADERRRQLEADRSFALQAQQVNNQTVQLQQGISMGERSFAFEKSKYADLKQEAMNQANEIRGVLTAFQGPNVSSVDALKIWAALDSKKQAQALDENKITNSAALQKGVLAAFAIEDPAQRLSAIQKAFEANPYGELPDTMTKQVIAAVNRDRMFSNQAVFTGVASASSIADLKTVQKSPGFASWYSDEVNRKVWNERWKEVEQLEKSGSSSQKILKRFTNGSASWVQNGIETPAIEIETDKNTNEDVFVYRLPSGERVSQPVYDSYVRDLRANNGLAPEGSTAVDESSDPSSSPLFAPPPTFSKKTRQDMSKEIDFTTQFIKTM